MILIIEPNFFLAKNLISIVSTIDTEIVHFSSIKDAILQFDKALPKYIIVSSHLKRHNFLEFIYEIKSYEDTWNIPIIILNYSFDDYTMLHKLFEKIIILDASKMNYETLLELIS